MKKNRLEMLYRRPLKPAEETNKELPLKFILDRPLEFYPEEPSSWQFDMVEIGPGRGDFLFHLAQNNPDKKILALELGSLRFKKLKKRLKNRNITNVTLVFGDARTSFYKYLKTHDINKCFVLFPDPWPRNRHAHNRLLQKDFCKIITDKLAVNGEFVLATDVKDYAYWAYENFKEMLCYDLAPGCSDFTKPLDELIPTFFKEKWESMDRDFYYVKLIKKKDFIVLNRPDHQGDSSNQ